MRTLICARAYPPDIAGGGEISTKLIAEGISQLGEEVHVLTFTDDQARTDSVQGVEVHRIQCPNAYWSIHSKSQNRAKKIAWHVSQAFRRTPPLAIQQAIQQIKPAILHTSTIEDFGPSTWTWAKNHGMVTVHSLRSYNLLHRQATLYDPKRDCEISPDFLSKPKKHFSRSLCGVIGISQCILEKHLQHGFFSNAKTKVIGNPISNPIEPAKNDTKPTGIIRLGILGRISPEKGIAPFLDCLNATEPNADWTLQIAGDGPEHLIKSLKRRCVDLPVQWLGWQKSQSFLETLDLLVVASRWHEPFGRIVVEAFAAGVPVLCLRRGAMPELIQEGVTGWMVKEWSWAAIKHAINHCRKLDRRIIQAAAERFTVQRIAQQHLAFYQTLMESNAATGVASGSVAET